MSARTTRTQTTTNGNEHAAKIAALQTERTAILAAIAEQTARHAATVVGEKGNGAGVAAGATRKINTVHLPALYVTEYTMQSLGVNPDGSPVQDDAPYPFTRPTVPGPRSAVTSLGPTVTTGDAVRMITEKTEQIDACPFETVKVALDKDRTRLVKILADRGLDRTGNPLPVAAAA